MHTTELLSDLLAEQDVLDAVVATLTADQWSLVTASPRWDVTDQIAHLTYFDHAAALAISDPEAFERAKNELWSVAAAGDAGVDALTLSAVRDLPVAERLGAWRRGRAELAAAAGSLTAETRVPWYGPDMGARSFLTARLMECWAHGQDIVDAVGATRPASDRLRHIAQLGVITRRWTYVNRGLEPPDGEVRVELRGPAGEIWTWGPADAHDVVRGGAEDFCLVVTQRRHLGDTDLSIDGEAARDWMTKAQAFAGPPTAGPAPRRSP